MTSQVEFTSEFGSIYDNIKQGLEQLGYTGGLLQEKYAFTDILSPGLSVKEIPLATFSQEPLSYHSACFGVVSGNGKSDISLVSEYRSLGAPQIFEITPNGLRRWGITSTGQPKFIDEVDAGNILTLFERHRYQWTPDNFNRTRSAPQKQLAHQLDFFDAGLLPLLDHEVQIKLDGLLTNTIIKTKEMLQKRYSSVDEYLAPLLRLIFRLMAAKILADRHHPGLWLHDEPTDVIKEVEDKYFRTEKHKPILHDYDAQCEVWQSIRNSFHFQNLSVETLAYVYENTLITKETRKKMSTHGTKPSLAEYIVRQLPFETLQKNERTVFEPFSGHAVFLVAALRRLRELLPSTFNSSERHDYFVNMLSGLELDEFAREVAKLSLMLADYPNPDGWNLYADDAFESDRLDIELSKANIVLCNPPFEDFKPLEQDSYSNILSVHKPAAILGKILQKPPRMLGFVLPRKFISGNRYRELRNKIGTIYSSIEVLALPDTAFEYSEAETVLLTAHGEKSSKVSLSIGEVVKKDLNTFEITHEPSYRDSRLIQSSSNIFNNYIWLPRLGEIWDYINSYDRLEEYVEIHRGVEYKFSLKEFLDRAVSDHERKGFVKGLHLIKGSLEPFTILNNVYINVSPEVMRTEAYELPWEKPKVIINALRRTRGPWKLTAASDDSGLYCIHSFDGVWPKADMPLEVISAILNNPLANAFISILDTDWNLRINTMYQIPVPNMTKEQQNSIVSLVRKYKETRKSWLEGVLHNAEAQENCKIIIQLIDAEVLKCYDLPPRLERMLLDYFAGFKRPSPVEFTEYYPKNFKPFIPLHLYTSQKFQAASARTTITRLPIINDPIISEALLELESGDR